MSTSSDTAKKWTCERCGVSVTRIDGGKAVLPDSWAASSEGCFCLGCRRDRAAEAALEAAPSDATRDVRMRLRRSAVIEFELRRTPECADNAIAKACRSSVPAVAEVRDRLSLPSPAPRPARKAPAKRQRASA
jgi:hypothetical protein